jgi:hypothetical protein
MRYSSKLFLKGTFLTDFSSRRTPSSGMTRRCIPVRSFNIVETIGNASEGATSLEVAASSSSELKASMVFRGEGKNICTCISTDKHCPHRPTHYMSRLNSRHAQYLIPQVGRPYVNHGFKTSRNTDLVLEPNGASIDGICKGTIRDITETILNIIGVGNGSIRALMIISSTFVDDH